MFAAVLVCILLAVVGAIGIEEFKNHQDDKSQEVKTCALPKEQKKDE